MEKYTTVAVAALPENKDKLVVSNDAYALAEMIDSLIRKIEQVRLNI